jgi:amino acid adenylation domain-containing protein
VSHFDPQLCLSSAFENTALRYPENIAVSDQEGNSLSYRELNERANQLAHQLISLGIAKHSRVGVLLDKNVELVVTLIAILKTGAAYIPLDPAYPAARIRSILNDAEPTRILSQEKFRSSFESVSMPVEICESRVWMDAVSKHPRSDLKAKISPDAAAYAIFTSGSTGEPKAALTSHRSVLRLFEHAQDLYGFRETDVWTLFHSYCFDFSVWEIWGALLFGGRLCVVPTEISRSAADFYELLVREKVSVLNATPSAFMPLMRRHLRASSDDLNLRYVILGGESLDLRLLAPWFEKRGFENPRLINGYGPTECTIFTSFKFVGPQDLANPISNIGREIKDLTVVVSESGELLISGPGVSLGYLKRPELSAEKFVQLDGKLFYRSGDKVRRLPTGDIEYLGRLDNQVKLRGFRIELGEIEAALATQNGVAQAAASLTGEGVAARIEAWVVLADPKASVTEKLLREGVKKLVPDYMVPTRIHVLQSLPLNAHGKLDRAQLSKLSLESAENLKAPKGASTGSLESQMLPIWTELLQRPALGREENFFDVGGSSLLGEVLIERLEVALGRPLSMLQLLAHPSIASLARFLSGAANSSETRSHRSSISKDASSAVAVIAMEGRFPGSRNVDEFWASLVEGRETLRFFKPEELSATEPREDPNYVAARGIVDAAFDFDAEFFGFTGSEATAMDPQQRLFLEICWQALEKAGYVGRDRPRNVGVFAGVSANTYFLNNVLRNPDVLEKIGLFGAQLLNEKDYVASRVAYKLDLLGPALSIHTACSTSLVAISEAFFALQEGRCEMALAGGASVLCPQNAGHVYQEGAMLSKDGHTLSFSEDSNGTVFSDGAGVVLLKRLDDALRDGDEVLAVIRGAAINNDGGLKPSFTAPSIEGQTDVIRQALASAGLRAQDISYIEAHGTGTPLGDPMELEALASAFRVDTDLEGFCALGSVKSNMGHLVAAAGVTGFMKAVLAVKHAKIPASLGCNKPTTKHDWRHSPFFVNTALREWKGPRRAGVSSFGVGGTNAHVVIESSAPRPELEPIPEKGPQLLVLSARSSNALRTMSRDWAEWLKTSAAPIQDIALSAARGRKFFSERRWLVAGSRAEALKLLESETAPTSYSGYSQSQAARDVLFLFPGNGTQYERMGEQLLRSDPVFAQHMQKCREISGPNRSPQADLLALEYSLARSLMDRGVEARALVGYSLGEFTAAVIAGVFSLEDAFALLDTQTRALKSVSKGSMLSVRLSLSELQSIVPSSVSLAASNSPFLSVVAGPDKELSSFGGLLTKKGVLWSEVPVEHAYHSPDMDSVTQALLQQLQKLSLREPRQTLYSSSKGRRLSPEEALSPAHWSEVIRASIQFQNCVTSAHVENPDVLWVELGPGKHLTTFARQCLPQSTPIIPSLSDRSDVESLEWLSCQGKLWASGSSILPPVDSDARKVPLPLYPFERKHYLAEASASALTLVASNESKPSPVANSVLEQVVTLFEDISGIEISSFGPDMSFTEMGLDSLFLTQAATALEKKFKVALSFRRLTEDLATLGTLSNYLSAQAPNPSESAAASVSVESPTTRTKSAEEAELTRVPFGAIARVSRSAEDFTPEQAQAFESWKTFYIKRTARSKAHASENRAHFADPRVVSGFKPSTKEIVYPVVVSRSKGSRLWDIDGNEYIDLLNGFGTNFLGHSPDFVKEAQKAQLDLGIEVGPSTPLAGETAKLFCEITANERAAFCCTGSEAVLGCVRIARTVTKRDLLVVFAGSYHGIVDEVIVRGGKNGRAYAAAPGIMPSSVGNVIVLEYGNFDSLRVIRERASEIAAVLVEPVQSRNPRLQPATFLKELRVLTEQTEICLIFDEVITGLRAHPQGAQAIFEVKADLASYGKVVGGSNPIGVIAGKRKFMDALDGGDWRFGDDSRPEVGVTYFAGTYLRHPLALSAAFAVLSHLKKEGPELQRSLNARTQNFVEQINLHLKSVGAPFELHHFASMFRLHFLEETPYSELLCLLLRSKGIHIIENFPCFLTASHTEADLERCRKAFEEAVTDMQNAGFFKRGEDRSSTPAQREIWMASQISSEASLAYNEGVELKLNGEVDTPALESALRWLVQRHASLRARFDAKTGALRDGSLPTGSLLSSEDVIETKKVFDLSRGPLIRFSLVKKSPSEHRLRICAHHIVCDGWSFGVVIKELALAYSAFAKGSKPELADSASMADYALTRAKLQEKNRKYWRDVYSTLPDRLRLPADKERPPSRGFASERLDWSLSPKQIQKLRDAGLKNGTSFFTTLFTGVATWFARMSGQNDFVIGVAKAGQASCNFPNLVGHCVNTLPVRVQPKTSLSFGDNIKASRSVLMDAFEHGDTTFGEILSDLKISRQEDRVPLMPVLFNLDQTLDVTKFDWNGLRVELASLPRVSENFELFLNAVETPDGGLTLETQYSLDLFSHEQITAMLKSLELYLASAAADPSSIVESLPLVSIEPVSESSESYDKLPALGTLLHSQLKVSDLQGRVLDRDELTRAATKVWQGLVSAGLRPGDRVALLVERSAELPAVLLGVLSCEAPYVPLDPQYPTAKIKEILSDAEPKLLLASRAYEKLALTLERNVVWLEDLLSQGEARKTDSVVLPQISSATPAYILYTSGSTGKSKGVVVSHGSLVNFLLAMKECPGLGTEDRIAAITNLTFDIAGLELYLPLICGAHLVVLDREIARDGRARLACLSHQRINTLQATPTSWTLLQLAGLANSKLRLRALAGGEPLSKELAQSLLQSCRELWNMYGPTETTIWSSCLRVENEHLQASSIPIGAPIRQTQIHILDSHLQPLPSGAIGEICIGGWGVASGYWKNEALTREKFVVPSFAGASSGPLIYRTGDLGRRLPNGDLQILGRSDQQVKIRGHRIEIGEVESALASIATITQSAVLAANGPAGLDLVAFYVSKTPLPASQIRNELLARLPETSLPTRYLRLDRLPMTANDKLDRIALKKLAEAPAQLQTSVSIPNDLGPSEQTLARAWSQILGVGIQELGRDSDFFLLGGHSVLALRLIGILEKEGTELALPDIFAHSTLATMAQRCRSSKIVSREIPHVGASTRVSLSPMQARLYYLARLFPDSRAFNLPAAFVLRGKLNRQALQKSLDSLLERQRALSLVVIEDTSGARLEDKSFKLDLGFEKIRPAKLQTRLDHEVRRSFNFKEGPLFWARVFETSEQEHVLAIVVHHLVFDGWSFDLLLDELSSRYTAYDQGDPTPTKPLELQYREIALWQSQAQLRAWDEHAPYWKQALLGMPPLRLPSDHVRPESLRYVSRMLEFSVPQAQADALTRFAAAEGATLSMLLLTAYKTLLHQWSRQEDFCVGVPVQGRQRPEVLGVIGFFVNTVLVRDKIPDGTSFVSLLRKVRDSSLGALAHQDMPFEKLSEFLPAQDRSSGAALYQAFFSYQDTRNRNTSFGNLELGQVHLHTGYIATEISLAFKETGRGLHAEFDYCTELFTPQTAERLMREFQHLLVRIADGTDFKVHVSDTTTTSTNFVKAHHAPSPSDTASPQTPTELKIAEIWTTLTLSSAAIRRSDTFFDVGGHSLLAIQLLNRLEESFGRKVNPQTLLTHTLAELAKALEEAPRKNWLDRLFKRRRS